MTSRLQRPLRTIVVLATTTPGLLVALAGAAWTAGAGIELWPPDRVNLAEAAATRNTAEVARLLAGGEKPDTRMSVRAGLLDGSHDVWVTPLEAAVRVRRGDVLWTLLQYGPPPDAATLDALRCEAAGDQGLLALLGPGVPGSAPPCRSAP
jgi:hypothetical protein